MVDDGYPVAGLKQLGRLNLLGTVGVHHHSQGAGVGDEQGVLRGEKCIVVFRKLRELVDQLLSRGSARIPDDVGGHPVFPAQGAHTGGGAQRVVVRGLVAHNKDLRGIGNQGGEGVGHDTAFHLCALFRLFGAAAVKLKSKLVADHRLIAAPGQGHVDGQVGKVEQLLVAVPVLADADGQGGIDAAGVDHLVDGIQNVKLGLHKAGQILFFKNKEIALPLIPAQQSAGLGHPGVQTVVNFQGDVGALVVGEVFGEILIVVNEQHCRHRTGGCILVPDQTELSDVHPVGGGQKASRTPAGTDQMSKDQKAPAAVGDLCGAFALAFHQPTGVKVGNQGRQLGIKEMFPLAGELQKAIVGPDDVVALRAEKDHR